MINWIRRKLGSDKVSLVKNPDTADAAKAVREATKARRAATDHTGEIAVLSHRMHQLRRENHFATLIRSAVLGEDKPS